jgi:hypothetical protein
MGMGGMRVIRHVFTYMAVDMAMGCGCKEGGKGRGELGGELGFGLTSLSGLGRLISC